MKKIHETSNWNKSLSQLFIACDCVTEHQAEALLEFTLFRCETVVSMFNFRLCSPVHNKSKHWVNKIASKCMQYPTRTKQQNIENATTMLFGIILVVANFVTRWKHSYSKNIFYNKQLPICVIIRNSFPKVCVTNCHNSHVSSRS